MQELSRLSRVSGSRDIAGPPYKPSCPHCPLYIAVRSIQHMEDAFILVLGITECTYYIRGIARSDGADGNMASIVMDWQDVTFGVSEKAENAFAELMEEYNPKAVFLVTTCVPEITGDDIDILAERFSEEYGIPVPVVHTEHFRSSGKLGTENVLTALGKLMEKDAAIPGSVNILGESGEGPGAGELLGILGKAGVPVNVSLPAGSMEETKRAARGALNIVTDTLAVPLAKYMEKEFGIPYSLFLPHIDPALVLKDYEGIFEKLGKPVPAEVDRLYKEASRTADAAGAKLSGKTYFAGQTRVSLYEFNSYLVGLGMKPLFIQAKDFEEEQDVINKIMPEENAKAREAVLKAADPFVAEDIDPESIYGYEGLERPDLFIGFERRKHEDTARSGFGGIEDFFAGLTGSSKYAGNRGGDYNDRGGKARHDGRYGEIHDRGNFRSGDEHDGYRSGKNSMGRHGGHSYNDDGVRRERVGARHHGGRV